MKTITYLALALAFLFSQESIAQSSPTYLENEALKIYETIDFVRNLDNRSLERSKECLIVINHFFGVDESFSIRIGTIADETIEYKQKQGNPITISGIYEKSINSIVLVNDESKMEYELLEMKDIIKSSCPITQPVEFKAAR